MSQQRHVAHSAGPWDVLLSPSEYEVVRLLVRGMQRKEVAHALGLSPHTVRWHTGRALLKAGVHSVPELAARYWMAHRTTAGLPGPHRARPDWYEHLTERERQVCDLLAARGWPQASAARALGISHHTYKHHLDNVLVKARAYSMVDAICLYHGGEPVERRPAPPALETGMDGSSIAVEQAPTWANHVRHYRP